MTTSTYHPIGQSAPAKPRPFDVVAALPADAPMTAVEHMFWYAAAIERLADRVNAMDDTERAAYDHRLGALVDAAEYACCADGQDCAHTRTTDRTVAVLAGQAVAA